jgi:hypothetical protein
MGLPWVRLDTGIATNHKMLTLIAHKQHRAITAYVFGLAYCGGQGSDGFIPAAALPFIHATKRDAQHLVDAGLWHVSDITPGWIVNDWGDYQPTQDDREARTTKSRKGNCIRWHGHACGCWRDPPGTPRATPRTYGRTNGLTKVVTSEGI